MKGFAGVTDNDWFAFLSQQLLLPKKARPKDGGETLQKDGGQARHKDGG